MTRRFALLAGATVIALGVALVGLGLRAADNDDQKAGSAPAPGRSTSTTATTAAATPSGKTELDHAIAEASAFVERTRDLRFLHPVHVELLDGGQFRARLFADAEEQRADVDVDEKVLRALHLIGPDVRLFETYQSFLSQAVVGFYDPKRDELVVRGAGVTANARVTLVHELTHALDDQHFELHRPQLDDAEDESSLAFSALVEGNAVRVQNAYTASLPKAERDRAAAEELQLTRGLDVSKVPSFITQTVGFPYSAGPALVATLLKAGGERRVDDAFEHPPTTTEQILRPADWLAGKAAPAGAPSVKADGPILDKGGYGELALWLTLESEVGTDAAVRAAVGWGGDRYVAWSNGNGVCVRAAFVMDTSRDLNQLTDALRSWAVGHGQATVERTGSSVGFTACG